MGQGCLGKGCKYTEKEATKLRTRPVIISTRATERERILLAAAATLEGRSLADTVRRYAVACAVDRLRAVEPQEDAAE